MADLNKEVWTDQVMENFYPDTSFLKYARDFSVYVDSDAINIAEAGVDPDVFINNTTYPIAVKQRIDTNKRIELDKFETENTLVRRPEAIEYSYDQLESVIMGHRNSLQAKTGTKAAHAYAPANDSLYTPVIQTSGDKTGNRLRLIPEDIINLMQRYDDAEIPLEGRYLVLDPKHLADLMMYDLKLFKSVTDLVNGEPQRFANFNILQFSKTPRYDNTLKKVPFDTAFIDDFAFCSFSFHSSEVLKADGELYMYSVVDDPKERATIIGFDKRFIAMPIRNRGNGAILSKIEP